MEERVRGWLAATGAEAGMAEGRMAEAFQVVHTG
jgi:hypothetical protein